MASKIFLIEYIHEQNMKVYIMSIPKSAIYELQASSYYCIDETMMIVTKKVNNHYMSGQCKNDRRKNNFFQVKHTGRHRGIKT